MILKLIGMIILGVLSAALSYYNKNYYVRVFDDILGKEEEEKTVARVGRGFLYGFFFPIYFVLLLIGLVALIAFLIAAGIIAGVVFVLVWVTEKLLPHEWFGDILLALFSKIGLKSPPSATQPAQPAEPVTPSSAAPGSAAPVPADPTAAPGETEKNKEGAPSPESEVK